MLAEKEKQEIEKEINEQKLKVLQDEEDARRKLETEEQEEKRKRIKEALNTQTFAQFKVYAEQQYLIIFVIHSHDLGLIFFYFLCVKVSRKSRTTGIYFLFLLIILERVKLINVNFINRVC